MTTNDEIIFNDETITIDTKARKLYYEGMLNSNIIPWNFSIRYFLDGVEYAADDIAGKKGALKITMSVRENTACTSPFFDNYGLQASFTLDTKLCKNIVTENATMANVGRKKQLTYTILPGKETDAVITADVTDFEMDGISINGVPLSMNLDVSIEDDEDLNELKDGVGKIDDGASELRNGSVDLQKGSKELRTGAKDLNEGINKLLQGSNSLDKGITKSQAGALNLCGGAEDLKSGATNIQDGIHGMSTGLQALSSQNDTLLSGAYSVFQQLTKQAEIQLNQNLTAMDYTTVTLTPENYNDTLNGLLAALEMMTESTPSTTSPSVVNTNSVPVSNINDAIMTLQKQLNDYNDFYRCLKSYTGGVQSAASGSISLADGTEELLIGAATLQEGTKGLYNGLIVLKEGSTELIDGVKGLQKGTRKLLDGTLVLEDGTEQLYNGVVDLSDGTYELRDQTADLDVTIKDKITTTIDDMMGAGFEPVSFVSNKNQNVEFVQFVVKTDGIFKTEAETSIEIKSEPLTFWQKLLKLFDWD